MRKRTLAPLLLLLATISLHAEAVLQVNLSQTASSPDEAGFTNWLAPDNSGPVSTTINGYGLSATGTRQ